MALRVAGVIVDGGTFDYAQYPSDSPELQRAPTPATTGWYMPATSAGLQFGANLSYILKARVNCCVTWAAP